jgi:hypothetical protein
MEGTRNERSVLITVSYIIGFVTAFILFLSNSNKTTESPTAIAQSDLSTNLVAGELKNSNEYIFKPYALESFDKKNIFYCEPVLETSDYCYGFLYSNVTKSTHKVYIDGQELSMKRDIISEVSWTDNGLAIANISSVNSNEPWHLVSPNTPIDLQ